MSLRVGDRDVHLLGVIPLHADEMQLKLDAGSDALYDLLDAGGDGAGRARSPEPGAAPPPGVLPPLSRPPRLTGAPVPI